VETRPSVQTFKSILASIFEVFPSLGYSLVLYRWSEKTGNFDGVMKEFRTRVQVSTLLAANEDILNWKETHQMQYIDFSTIWVEAQRHGVAQKLAQFGEPLETQRFRGVQSEC
jgi:hypothetical protein